jgi:hypothetical protein
MRTKFITALGAAVLLTVGSAGAALAQAADAQASANDSAPTYTYGAANAGGDMPTYGGFAPNVGPSAHYHPHGVRQR